jgi:hypothetical protein
MRGYAIIHFVTLRSEGPTVAKTVAIEANRDAILIKGPDGVGCAAGKEKRQDD